MIIDSYLEVPIVKYLDISQCPKGKISRYFVKIVADGMGLPIYIPVLVAKGKNPGGVLGITAATHGNELNGIPVIQRLFKELEQEIELLKGVIVGVPVMNVPAYLSMQRQFNDGIDLNRIMPGKPDGSLSEVYAYRLIDRIVSQFDYLLDMHTASFGRINSYYIRANIEDKETYALAQLQNAQIILNSPAKDQTVRGVVQANGGKAITLEVGDPNTFQRSLIRSGLSGIHNTLIFLGMVDGQYENHVTPPVVCEKSYWIHTDKGGILQVLPNVTDQVQTGERIAIMRNIFGDTIKEYFAPQDGIVIGKSIHPVSQTGSRILHLGIPRKD
jgi:predicted deacylase